MMRLLDAEEEAYFESRRGPTTLMVRNIGSKLTAARIREQIDALGFGDTYDFFHLPLFRTGRFNQGYFFLNFKQADDAERFRVRLHGEPFGTGRTRPCEVCAATWQGLTELHEHFDRKIANSVSRPLFLTAEL